MPSNVTVHGKPHGVCWCDCHMPVDEQGLRQFGNGWPRFDDAIAAATACLNCKDDHTLFITTGRDWLWDRRAPLEEG